MTDTIEFAGDSNDSSLASGMESSTWAPSGSIGGSSVLESPAKGNENSASMNAIPANFTDSPSQSGGGTIEFTGGSEGRVSGAQS